MCISHFKPVQGDPIPSPLLNPAQQVQAFITAEPSILTQGHNGTSLGQRKAILDTFKSQEMRLRFLTALKLHFFIILYFWLNETV